MIEVVDHYGSEGLPIVARRVFAVLENAGGSLIRVSKQSKSEIGGIEEGWSLIWNVTAEGLERPALERQRTENVEGLGGADRSEGAH